MVNEFGYLEEADLESQAQEDDQSQVDDLYTPGGRRDTLRRVFGGEDTSSDEEDQGEESPVEDEHVSPPGPSSHLRVPQVDCTGTGPTFLPGPSTSNGRGGRTLYSQLGEPN